MSAVYHKKRPYGVIEKDRRCDDQHCEPDQFIKLRSVNIRIAGYFDLPTSIPCCKKCQGALQRARETVCCSTGILVVPEKRTSTAGLHPKRLSVSVDLSTGLFSPSLRVAALTLPDTFLHFNITKSHFALGRFHLAVKPVSTERPRKIQKLLILQKCSEGHVYSFKMETVQMQSAVRLPTPEPLDAYQPRSYNSKRKRSSFSRSPSPRRYRSPPRQRSRSASPVATGPLPKDVDRTRAMERQRQLDVRLKQQKEPAKPSKSLTTEEKEAAAKAEYEKLLNMRSGGTYIPPAKLRALQAQITDKTSKEYQRMAWEALKKSINGLINKVNISNIKHIVPELFGENLIRGRGLFCRSIMKAQSASLPFTPIYAAMVAIVNTKLPQVGELLVNRLVVQFRKAFKRNDKAVCLSSTTFIAHLVNQQVVNEMVAAQMLLLLLHKPTDDSVEIAVGLTREVGHHLEEMNRPISLAVFDQFRNIIHEADIDKRVQYMIEVLFQVRKDKYKDNPSVKEELDLVEEEDQITHSVGLEDEVDVQDGLNVFKFDPEWQEHEDAYKKLKAEILGEADGSDEDDEDDSDGSSEDEEDEKERQIEIKDQTNTDLVNLRRTIYLTIQSSGGFEECVHKLLKLNLPVGQEGELTSMVVECASQQRTYQKFYGLIAERFSRLNRLWLDLFEGAFAKYYDTIHRYEANRLRIIAQLFGHLLSTDAIGWHVLSVIHLNEDETTSSSRIFIKILFEKLAEDMGMKSLQARMNDRSLGESFAGIFPKDDTRNTRFSINFFTAIGMGSLTEDLREFLKSIPKPALPAIAQPEPAAETDSESVSSYSSYSSRSRSPPARRGREDTMSRSPSPNHHRRYSPSPSRSPSPSPRHGRRSSPPPRNRRRRSLSTSASPPPRRGARKYSSSRSPSPAPRRVRSRHGRSPPPHNGKRGRSATRSPQPRRRRNSSSVSVSRSPRRTGVREKLDGAVGGRARASDFL